MTPGRTKDIESLFVNSDVQRLLQSVTGFNLERIFTEHFAETTPPKYELLTDQELEEERGAAAARAGEKLQMPPVLRARELREQVLSEDPQISGHNTHNLIFTDITFGLEHTKRAMIVREPEGRLRLANNDERDRALQVYYPRPGRMYNMPTMFKEVEMERILSERRYQYLLDRACLQFEPDDSEYIRVTQRAYEHILEHHEYESLRSSRHFGPMVFYLTLHKKVDGLLVDMLQRDLSENAADTVRLFSIVHPDSKSADYLKAQPQAEALDIVQHFASNDTPHGGEIELALQTYREGQAATAS